MAFSIISASPSAVKRCVPVPPSPPIPPIPPSPPIPHCHGNGTVFVACLSKARGDARRFFARAPLDERSLSATNGVVRGSNRAVRASRRLLREENCLRRLRRLFRLASVQQFTLYRFSTGPPRFLDQTRTLRLFARKRAAPLEVAPNVRSLARPRTAI